MLGNTEDARGGFLGVNKATYSPEADEPYQDGDPDEIISEEQLPFTTFKHSSDKEEDFDTIRTGTLLYHRYPSFAACAPTSSGMGS